jgi:hypothetical protein
MMERCSVKAERVARAAMEDGSYVCMGAVLALGLC